MKARAPRPLWQLGVGLAALLFIGGAARREASRSSSQSPPYGATQTFPAAPASTPPAPPLVAGYEFHLESDTPYKLFTTPQIRLRLALEKDSRAAKNVRVEIEARDFNGQSAARQSSTFAISEKGALKFELPVFTLPKLGWYQIQTTLRDAQSNEVLASRVQFVGRTFMDANLPIPEREYTGWDDLRTHHMIGMGLHRFDLNSPQQIDEFAPDIALARQMKVPYFVLLIRPEDCTPAGVSYVLQKLKTLGDDAPSLEIVNEPNLKMRASRYLEILKVARDAIKAQSPNAQVIGPAQCGTQLFWFENFLHGGGGDLVDIVSVHTYERNGAMDVYHWQKKFAALRALMKKYHCKKPLWQTEHGFLGDLNGALLRPQWQARQITLEQNTLARFGIGPTEYFYYYVNEGGYRDFSAQVVDGARELYPAALMTRTRAHFINKKKWAKAIDFNSRGGAPGNWLMMGDEYSGDGETVVVLQNCGALQTVPIQIQNSKTPQVFDAFGNALSFQNPLPVGRFPLYLIYPSAQKIEIKLAGNFGADIAPAARVLCDDANAQISSAKLTNGLLEFDFHDEPQRVGFLASDNHLPLDVTLQWNETKIIKSAILYGSLADNQMSTPLDYEMFAHQNGAWKKVGEVHQNPATQFFAQGIPRLTNYDNPWIFLHDFPTPISTDALRFRFLKTTRGQFADGTLADAINPRLQPRVELREVQVFAP